MHDLLDDMVVEVRVTLVASLDEVFDLLSDVEQMAGLGPEHVEARWEGTGPALGASFTGRNVRGEREWSLPCRVDVFDPPNAFGWIVGDPDRPTAYWRYRLAQSSGGISVVQTFRHGPGWSLLRTACERFPDSAVELVEQRGRELSSNMHHVLQQAANRLPRRSSER